MSYSISNGSLVSITIKGLLNNQVVMMERFYRVSGASTNIPDGKAALSDLINYVDSADSYMASWANAATSALHFSAIQCQWIYQERYAFIANTPVFNTDGLQDGSDPLPQNVSVGIIARADTTGLGSRGTVKPCGLVINQVTQGLLNTQGKTDWQPLASALKNTITIGTLVYTPVIFAKSNPLISQSITSCILAPEARTMMRRRVGLGI